MTSAASDGGKLGVVSEAGVFREVAEEAERVAVLAGLLRDLRDLTTGRHVTFRDAPAQGLDVAVDRAGDVAETLGDERPVVAGLRRHQVEDLADALRGRRDHVEVAQVVAGIGRGDLEPQFRRDVGLSDFVDLVDGLLGSQRVDDLLGLVDVAGVTGRRVVADLADAALDAHPDRGVGVEVDHRRDPVLRDLVDGRARTDGLFGHAPSLRLVTHGGATPRRGPAREGR